MKLSSENPTPTSQLVDLTCMINAGQYQADVLSVLYFNFLSNWQVIAFGNESVARFRRKGRNSKVVYFVI